MVSELMTDGVRHAGSGGGESVRVGAGVRGA
jgi:hypothetical protein